jgi:peptidoglycan/xylan/chitin deacetylase (PgdA/CDA1 family)
MLLPRLRGTIMHLRGSVALRIPSARYSQVFPALTPFMSLPRFVALCALCLLSRQIACAQNQPAEPSEPRQAPAPTAAPSTSGPQITFNSVHVDGPYIAMTFDDGPNATLTPKLLDLLAKNRMKATFFVVGQNVAEYPEIVKRAAREGHEIASHSWSHPNLGKMGDDGVRRELQKTDDAIVAATGTRPTLMRPPYGSITARQKSWIHEAFGYRIIIWDVDPLDWRRPGPSVVTQRIVSGTQPGSIILAHDIHAPTLEAMPETFEQLLAKGFKFVTVSELLAMARPAPPKPPAAPAGASPSGATSSGAKPAQPAAPSPATPNG